MSKNVQEAAWYRIIAERDSQDKKWGEQNHLPGVWLPILMEEVGEMSQEINCLIHGNPDVTPFALIWADYKKELTQVAAVALAMLECALRQDVASKPTEP